MPEKADFSQFKVGERIRQLRTERRWTQAMLAKLLGISQNYLSVLERGSGSFTAEQLLIILKYFNVSIDYFANNTAPVEDQLHNALARQGASHLAESVKFLPSDKLKQAIDSIRETLLSTESSRQITGIAPVIVINIRNLNFHKLRAQLAEAGLERRLAWVLENTAEALRLELKEELPREWAIAYKKAEIILRPLLAAWPPADPKLPEDYLDPHFASEESVEEIHEESSAISRKWRILTGLQIDDFTRALQAARD